MQDLPTNKERGERAYRLLVSYANEHNGGDIESSIADLIADIAHLADDYDGGEQALHMGAVHYRAERDGEDFLDDHVEVIDATPSEMMADAVQVDHLTDEQVDKLHDALEGKLED